MENSPITADCILSGLGKLDRKELAGMIALLENTKLFTLVAELAEKAGDKLKLPVRMEGLRDKVLAATDKINESTDETNSLRHRLWCLLRNAVDFEISLPLATLTARRESVELAHNVSRKLSSEYGTLPEDARRSERALDWIKRKAPLLKGRETLEFGKIVELEAAKLLGILLKKDALDEQTKSRLMNEIREKFGDLPADLKNDELRKAVSSGDWKITGSILAGGSFGGIALATEIAGFSAYILAAKASAIVPFIGGKTAVSLLAVMANPLFLVFMAAVGWFALSGTSSSVGSAAASRITVILALKGIMNRRDGCAALLNDFRAIDLTGTSTFRYLDPDESQVMRARAKRVEELAGRPVSSAPSVPPPPWDKPPEGKDASIIEDLLCVDRERSHNRFDVFATATLTAGDLLYAAWSIDPLVIQAAGFSRATDINDVFQFSAFAGRWKEMPAESAQGLENSLQGYAAEQLVLTRLIEDGHSVEMAGASNTPGFDVVVDGVAFQIKCGGRDSLSLLAEHFEKHEDIPVIANTELAARASGQPWADQVFAVEGFDLETVRNMVSSALEEGSAMDDIPVPLYAVIVGVARNLQDLKDGRMGLSDLPGEIAIEVAIRGALAGIGMKAGAAAGLILFGPAGAVILPSAGGVASLLLAPKVRQTIEKTVSRDGSEEVVNQAILLKSDALAALDKRLHYLNREYPAAKEPNALEIWLYSRKLDDIIAAAEQRADIESQNIHGDSDCRALLGRVAAAGILDPSVRKTQMALIRKLKDKPKSGDALRKGATRFGKKISKTASKMKS